MLNMKAIRVLTALIGLTVASVNGHEVTRYRTPVKNLYMCGSATHPGGGIMGGPGRLAALEMLKDMGVRS